MNDAEAQKHRDALRVLQGYKPRSRRSGKEVLALESGFSAALENLDNNIERSCTLEFLENLNQLEQELIVDYKRLALSVENVKVREYLKLKTYLEALYVDVEKSWMIYFKTMTSDVQTALKKEVKKVIKGMLKMLNYYKSSGFESPKFKEFLEHPHTIGVMDNFFRHQSNARFKLNLRQMISSEKPSLEWFKSLTSQIPDDVFLQQLVYLKHYRGIDTVLREPEVFLGVEVGKEDQFFELILNALQMEPGLVEKLGEEGLTKDDFFDTASFLLSRAGYYYYDARSTQNLNGTYTRRVLKRKVDAIWDNYLKVKASVDAQFEMTLSSLSDDEGGQKLRTIFVEMKKTMIKKGFMVSAMVYLTENPNDGNFERFKRGVLSSNIGINITELQKLLNAYSDVYKGIDASNLDAITDALISELPFILLGAGLSSAAVKLVVAGVKAAGRTRKVETLVNLVTRASRAERQAKRSLKVAEASHRAQMAAMSDPAILLLTKRGLKLTASSLDFLLTQVPKGALSLFSTMFVGDYMKKSVSRFAETGELDLVRDFKIVFTNMRQNLTENENSGESLLMYLIMPQVAKAFGHIYKSILPKGIAPKAMERLEAKIVQLNVNSTRSFALKLSESMRGIPLNTLNGTLKLTGTALLASPAYKAAVDILNALFASGLSKSEIYEHLLFVTRDFKHCTFVNQREVSSLSVLIMALKTI